MKHLPKCSRSVDVRIGSGSVILIHLNWTISSRLGSSQRDSDLLKDTKLFRFLTFLPLPWTSGVYFSCNLLNGDSGSCKVLYWDPDQSSIRVFHITWANYDFKNCAESIKIFLKVTIGLISDGNSYNTSLSDCLQYWNLCIGHGAHTTLGSNKGWTNLRCEHCLQVCSSPSCL